MPSPTSTPAALVSVDTVRLPGTKIRFWHPWTGATADTLQALVDEFNRSNEYQISVEVTAQVSGWDDLENRLTGALETGEPPDLAAGFMHQALRWDAQKKIVDLGPYHLDSNWGLGAEAQADYYPAVWAAGTTPAGQRLLAPLLPSASVFIYNSTWAQELGYRIPPTSIQQFADQTCAAADLYRSDEAAENDGTGGMVAVPDYAAALNWIFAFGGQIAVSPETESDSAYAFDQSETIDAFTFLRELYDDGCMWASDQIYTEEAFASRAALFTSADLLDLPYVLQAVQRAGRGDNWAVIPYPSNGDASKISLSSAGLLVFKSTPERQLAAWLLAKWLIQPSNHARLVQAAGGFPLRRSELAQLNDYRIANPQWSMALDLLPNAEPEPAYGSWGETRWAVNDAFTQLFRSYFEAKNIPTMLEYLDAMAAELHTGEQPKDLFTPVPTPTK